MKFSVEDCKRDCDIWKTSFTLFLCQIILFFVRNETLKIALKIRRKSEESNYL